MAKTNTKTAINGKVRGKRLTPEEHIPTAKLALLPDGTDFGVEVTTGRTREVLTVAEAFARSDRLDGAAQNIAYHAKRANGANERPNDERPIEASASFEAAEKAVTDG